MDTKTWIACGLCIKLCPTGNITEDGDEHPAWGRNCLLCLTCELKCPKDAITSPVSCPFTSFQPLHSPSVRLKRRPETSPPSSSIRCHFLASEQRTPIEREAEGREPPSPSRAGSAGQRATSAKHSQCKAADRGPTQPSRIRPYPRTHGIRSVDNCPIPANPRSSSDCRARQRTRARGSGASPGGA